MLYPTEQEQYRAFSRVVKTAAPETACIRLFDAGNDKPPPYMTIGNEENPALSLRGVRFLLSEPDFMYPHLRAILQASVHGPVNLILPMVSDLQEVIDIKKAIDRTAQMLSEKGVDFARPSKIGIMLEVPSAVWALEWLLSEVDFVSIGTNDLMQDFTEQTKRSEGQGVTFPF